MKSSSVKVKAGVCLDPAVTIKTVSGIEGGWEGGDHAIEMVPEKRKLLEKLCF